MHNDSIFCNAPFTNVRIENRSDRSVIFKPCCVYQSQSPIPSLQEYFNGDEMQALRNNKLYETMASSGCDNCSVPEKMGLTSIRKQLLQQPWASADNKVYSVEIFFGNTCNLGCAMCSPDVSSFAAEERYQAGIMPIRSSVIDNIQVALDTIDQLLDLKSVTFIGGEFFLVKRNAEILDKIIQKNIQCVITTNATVLTEPLLQKLQQIKDIQIGISVDGVEDVYNFMRYPADWTMLNSNIDTLKKRIPWADYCVRAVAQPLNIQNFHEIFQWANKKLIPMQYQVLVTPEHLSWKILTEEEKKKTVQFLIAKQSANYKITRKQKHIIDDFINGIVLDHYDANLRQQGVEYMAKLFAHRKISADTIQTQFGIFTNLANQVIEKMRAQ